MSQIDEVVKFWFEETDEKYWWTKDAQFDETIRERFGELHSTAIRCELADWRDSDEGRLAEIIVLDQFSRNLFRDSPLAFAADPLALGLAQEAVRNGSDLQLPERMRAFVYLPYMHSESAMIHQEAVDLYTKLGNENNLEFELKHKRIIDQFGRYPHRNKVLGRDSTAEELEFLKQPGSSF